MSTRGVAVTVGDRPKFLRFTLNSLAELESALGKPVTTLDQAFGFKEQRAFFWAGLLHTEPKLTILEAGELLDPVMADPIAWRELMDKVIQAFTLAFPKAKEGEAEKNAQSAAGTGTE